MYMNLLVIVIIGGLGYLWVTRGFFSGLINLVCCLMAGALAFAFWEPLSLFFLEKLPRTGFGAFLWQSSWALGLAIPFGGSFAILRAVLDKVLPANIGLEPSADYVGGGVCGVAAGAVTAGMVVMSLGMLRVDTDFLGYRRLENNGGSIVRSGRLWVPVDDLVAGIYGRASTGVFANADALAHYYPNLADTPEMLRSSEGNGKALNTMLPASVQVTRRYRVGADGATLNDLLGADMSGSGVQQAADINGERFTNGATLEGYVLQFAPSAREKNGQIVIGPGQVRLLTHRLEGSEVVESKAVFPVASVSLANATPPRYGRWRFDAPNVFISSVGGASELLFGFEFVVPNGFTPVGLVVKGVRYPIDVNNPSMREGGNQYRAYTSPAVRDTEVLQGELVGSLLPWTEEQRRQVEDGETGVITPERFNPSGVETRNSLPNSFIIQKGTEGGIEYNSDNRIIQGTSTFTKAQLSARGLERQLQIRAFVNTDTTAVVTVDVSVDGPNDLYQAQADGATDSDRVQLVDIHGSRFEPVGYVQIARDVVTITYNPGNPITSLGALPRMSSSQAPPDYQLFLIFRVSSPTELASFEVGDVVVQQFEEPIVVEVQPTSGRR